MDEIYLRGKNYKPMRKQLSLIFALVTGFVGIVNAGTPCACSVYVPNVFSPDGEGDPDNETFRPFLPSDCTFTDYNLRIFDRWGKLVYESSNPEEAWDGAFNGRPLTANVYVYVIRIHFSDAEEAKPEIITGDVALIRK